MAFPCDKLVAKFGFFTAAPGPEGAMMNTEDRMEKHKLSTAGWITLVILAAFFLVSLWYAAKVWTSMAGVTMSGFGWTFLVLGVIVTVALGAGLMALVFYSARHDMDR
jgi:hypothetical protein